MTQTQENENELLTVQEVAKQLRVDDTTVRRWISQGTLQAITLPNSVSKRRHSYRIPSSTLRHLMALPVTPQAE